MARQLLRSDRPLADEPRTERTRRGFAEALALCEAYAAYRSLLPAHISFEHLVYLRDALSRGDERRLATCRGCGALLVAERVALREPRGRYCAMETRWVSAPPAAGP